MPGAADEAAAARTRHERLRASLAALELSAPADIWPSIETFGGDMLVMGDFYERFDFDLDAATDAIVDDPDVADEFAELMAADTTGFDDAVLAIEQYSLAACGIDITDGAQS